MLRLCCTPAMPQRSRSWASYKWTRVFTSNSDSFDISSLLNSARTGLAGLIGNVEAFPPRHTDTVSHKLQKFGLLVTRASLLVTRA